MFEVDAMCKVALEGENALATAMSREVRMKLASLFSLLARIEAKHGFIDYLIMKRKV
ncbi:hypothetical protein D3C77_734390 [compost metagenome]